MNKITWVALAFLAGAFLPIQAGLNAKLGRAGSSPVHASLISFVVGTVALIAYIILTRQTVSWVGIRSAPAHVWVAGILGAFYVTVIILAFPQLGPGVTFGLVVAGQMTISILLEQFNILASQPHPITPMRVLGVLFVVGGVVIIRKF